MLELMDKAFGLDVGIGGSELPIDVLLASVTLGFSRLGLPTQGIQVGDTAVQTLLGEDAEFPLSDIEPTPVLGGVANFQALRQTPGDLQGKVFIERTWLVGVEVIAH